MTAVCNLLQTPATAEPVKSAPTPDWVSMARVPKSAGSSADEVSGGIEYLLSEQQYRWRETGYEFFWHSAYKVQNRSGLETASRLSPSYDPETSDLRFNFIRVIRDGVENERLENLDAEYIRRESNLDAGIITGDITVLIEMNDIRVGDIVEYAYSSAVDQPLWPGHFFLNTNIDWSAPVGLQKISVFVPPTVEISTKSIGTDKSFKKKKKQGWVHYSFEEAYPEPKEFEDSVPSDIVTSGVLSLSTMMSWNEVAMWGADLYAIDETLPESFWTEVTQATSGLKSDSEKIAAALRLVQNKIRYVGVETGLGSHKPREPGTTLANGYGDCKDKSVLLVAVLRRLGIKSFPALAHSSAGHLLDKHLPSIGVFNHAIVGATASDGTLYWMDPTLSHQGGRTMEALGPLDYGWVLPLRRDRQGLDFIEPQLPDGPTTLATERFVLPEEGDIAMTLVHERVYSNFSANSVRGTIANSGLEAYRQSYTDYYNEQYPGIEIKAPVTVSDDLEANEITVSGSFEMNRNAFDEAGLGTQLFAYADTVSDSLVQVTEDRRYDIALPYGANLRHKSIIETPGRQIGLPANIDETITGVTYRQNYSRQDDILEVEYAIVASERTLPKDESKALNALVKKIGDNAGLRINLSVSQPSLSRLIGADTKIAPEIISKLDEATRLISKGEITPALTAVNAAADLTQEPGVLRGYIQHVRGALLLELKRTAAAKVALAEGLQYFHAASPQIYVRYLELLDYEKDAGEIGAMISQMLAAHESGILALDLEWLSTFVWNLKLAKNAEQEDIYKSLVIGVADALIGNDLKTYYTDWLLKEAMDKHLENNNAKAAKALVSKIQDPQLVALIQMDKQARKLWSVLPNSKTAWEEKQNAFVQDRKAVFEKDPTNFKAINGYAAALAVKGDLNKLLRFSDEIVKNETAVKSAGFDGFGLIGTRAVAMTDLDNIDGALAELEKFIALGVENYPTLIKLLIDQSAIYLKKGDFDEALQAADRAYNQYPEYSNDFGKAFIHMVRACATHKKGATEEANRILENDLKAIADKNYSAYTEALLCLGRKEDAVDALLDRIDRKKDGGFIFNAALGAQSRSTSYPLPLELQEEAEAVWRDPRVEKAFAKIGRKSPFPEITRYWGSF